MFINWNIVLKYDVWEREWIIFCVYVYGLYCLYKDNGVEIIIKIIIFSFVRIYYFLVWFWNFDMDDWNWIVLVNFKCVINVNINNEVEWYYILWYI